MVRKSCLKVILVSPTYDFEVRSAVVLPPQLGSLASVYRLFHVWHAAAYDTILFLLNSVLSVFVLISLSIIYGKFLIVRHAVFFYRSRSHR